jgi:menaquinone-dependent protoporphyrinogen oxidase
MVVLVGYASEHGSTRGIAERVAARLGEHGSRVEVLSLDQVRDVGGYDAVVLGSAIHNQAWLPQATQFVRRNLGALAGRPLWLFSVGMPDALPGPLRALARKEEAKVIAGFRDAIRPRGHHLFSGVFHRDQVPFVGRLIFRAMGGRYGDFRDWQQIDAWAQGIARQLPLR